MHTYGFALLQDMYSVSDSWHFWSDSLSETFDNRCTYCHISLIIWGSTCSCWAHRGQGSWGKSWIILYVTWQCLDKRGVKTWERNTVWQTKRMRKKCGRIMCERDKCKEEKGAENVNIIEVIFPGRLKLCTHRKLWSNEDLFWVLDTCLYDRWWGLPLKLQWSLYWFI